MAITLLAKFAASVKESATVVEGIFAETIDKMQYMGEDQQELVPNVLNMVGILNWCLKISHTVPLLTLKSFAVF